MILVALVTGGIHLHGIARRYGLEDRARVSAYAAVLADRVADDDRSVHRADAPDWVPRIAGLTGLRAIAVLDPDGQIIHGFPSSEFLNELLKAAEVPSDTQPAKVEFSVASEKLSCLLAAEPILGPSADRPIGRVIIAMDRTPLNFRAELGTFMTVLACAVVLNFALLNHLNRRLIRPLHHLARIKRVQIATELAKLEPGWCTDELQCIGRLIRHLHENVEHCLQDITDLESTVDRRVDARTRQIATALKQSQKQSGLDPLTKLHNRRILDERLGSILAAHLGAGQDLSVVVVDVDHFKQVNDLLGHGEGDALLEFIGQLFRGGLRESGMAARYGGDEFVLVLTDTSAKEALRVVQRIIVLFAQHAGTLDIEPKPSLSAGIVSLGTSDARDPDRLLQLADQALYAAKHNGKSTAVIHGHDLAHA